MRYQYDRLHKEDVQICFVRFVRVLGVIVFGLLVAHLPVEAQWRMKGPFNRFSLEVQTGADFPIWLMTINDQNVKTSELQDPLKHVGVPNFQAGLRYMFTDWVGVRPFYAQHRFQHTIDSTGLKSRYKMQLFGLEGVLNLAEVLPAGGYRNPRKWNVLLHVGAGLASEFAKQNTITHLSRSRLAMGMGGITTEYRLLRNLAVYVDLTAHLNVAQSVGFDGAGSSIASNQRLPNSGMLSLNFGLVLYFGRHAHHVDWK